MPGTYAPGMEQLVSMRDIATALGVSERTARRIADSGELPSVYVRGRRLFRVADVNAYVYTHDTP